MCLHGSILTTTIHMIIIYEYLYLCARTTPRARTYMYAKRIIPRVSFFVCFFYYYYYFLFRRKWFMASLYANRILYTHHSTAAVVATAARILSGNEEQVQRGVEKKNTTPTAYRYTRECAEFIRRVCTIMHVRTAC